MASTLPLPEASPYVSVADEIAKAYKVPVDLFRNLIGVESNWNPNAIGKAGEIGLAQLMPATANSLGVNAFDPKSNLEGAARLLTDLFKKTGSWEKALNAYNSGNQKGTSPASVEYVKKVMTGLDPATGSAATPGINPNAPSPGGNQAAFPTINALLQLFAGSVKGALSMILPDEIYNYNEDTDPAVQQAMKDLFGINTDDIKSGAAIAGAGGDTIDAAKSHWPKIVKYGLAFVVIGGSLYLGLRVLSTQGVQLAGTVARKATT